MSSPSARAFTSAFVGEPHAEKIGSPELLPQANLPEFCFIGRSNAGKSSLLNRLCGRKTLAPISRQPGRTRHLTFYTFGGTKPYLRFVDLPGYGYNALSKAHSKHFAQLMKSYLVNRPNLLRAYLLSDGAAGIKDTDRAMMKTLADAGVSFRLLLTKVDRAKVAAEIDPGIPGELSHFLTARPDPLATSAKVGTGLAELQTEILSLATAWHG